MRSLIKAIALLSILAALLFSARAEAATFNVCLRLPVTIDDMIGTADEIGVTGNWIARGIYISHVRQPNGVLVSGFPKLAGQSDGCFSFTSSQSGNFEIGIQPVGSLSGNNTLIVYSGSGLVPQFDATINLGTSGGTVVFPTELATLRLYAVFAYSIQSGFRGSYSGKTLHVYANRQPPCSSTAACDVECEESSTEQYISICPGSYKRKFVMGHEWGHAVLEGVLGFAMTTNCTFGSGHNMRSLEFNSCAAMEGWAHFVAADMWNGTAHDGDLWPDAWYNYPGALGLISLHAGQGGCQVSGETVPNFRNAYADSCFFPFCGNDCSGMGVELDWMRHWWEYHTNGVLAGPVPSHAQMQADIAASGGWDATTAWTDLHVGLSGDDWSRFESAGTLTGANEP
jgi:hypothetical protein